MHMADALISPAVGGVVAAATIGVAGYSIKKLKDDLDDKKIPLMGVMGAFIFAAQMINFSIPGTGSSGHIGGGLLLAILLGPYAGFLTMASVLVIQALFFADGGLLALGTNVFNMGFYVCFLIYPLIYSRIMKKGYTQKRLFSATMLSAIIGLQLGAFSVVLETVLSGKTELPFGTFFALMQPIHLAIGIVEGLITYAVVWFIYKARPELIERTDNGESLGRGSNKKVIIGLLIATVLTAGILSTYASSNPDGLEWAIFNTTGSEEISTPKDDVHETLSNVQENTAILPDYNFSSSDEDTTEITDGTTNNDSVQIIDKGTSLSGILGGLLTLLVAGTMGILIKVLKRKNTSNTKK